MTEIEQQIARMKAETARLAAGWKAESDRLDRQRHQREDADEIARTLRARGLSSTEAATLATEASKAINRDTDGTAIDLAGDLRSFMAARSSSSDSPSATPARQPSTEGERIRAREIVELRDALREAGVPRGRRDAAIEEILAASPRVNGGHCNLKSGTDRWVRRYQLEMERDRSAQAAQPGSGDEIAFSKEIAAAVGSTRNPANKADQAVWNAVLGAPAK